MAFNSTSVKCKNTGCDFHEALSDIACGPVKDTVLSGPYTSLQCEYRSCREPPVWFPSLSLSMCPVRAVSGKGKVGVVDMNPLAGRRLVLNFVTGKGIFVRDA